MSIFDRIADWKVAKERSKAAQVSKVSTPQQKAKALNNKELAKPKQEALKMPGKRIGGYTSDW